MAERTVAVTGATGFVGRHIVRKLLSRSFGVRALVRDPAKGAKVLGRHEALTLVKGDVADSHATRELVGPADACIHLVGIIREARGGQTFERMHVKATHAVVGACEDAGTRRYLHMSALGVGAEGLCAYQKTKWQAEQRVRASSLDWTIFRPSIIHGPESEFVRMVAMWSRGHGLPAKVLPYFTRSELDTRVVLGPVMAVDPIVAPISVDDVAASFVAALDRPESVGEIYNLAGPDAMPFPRMLTRIRDAVPRSMPDINPRGVPAKHAAMAARAARILKLDTLLPFDEGMALMASADSVAEIDKAETHLGLQPAHFAESLARYAASL